MHWRAFRNTTNNLNPSQPKRHHPTTNRTTGEDSEPAPRCCLVTSCTWFSWSFHFHIKTRWTFSPCREPEHSVSARRGWVSELWELQVCVSEADKLSCMKQTHTQLWGRPARKREERGRKREKDVKGHDDDDDREPTPWHSEMQQGWGLPAMFWCSTMWTQTSD